MKINFKKLVDNDKHSHYTNLRQNVVVELLSILTNGDIRLISENPEYRENSTFDMSVTINGVESNAEQLIENIVVKLTDKYKLISEFETKYISKNSYGAKLQKVNEQLGSVKTMLQNIESTLSKLNQDVNENS
jgi:hypothetical protein